MTPTIVHRYLFSARETIEALLGDAAVDAERWQIRVDGQSVVIDLEAPAVDRACFGSSEAGQSISEAADPILADRIVADIEGVDPDDLDKPQGSAAGDVSPLTDGHINKGGVNEFPSRVVERPPPPASMRSELKGGPLARNAGICCGEKGFQTFVGAADEAAAAEYVYRLCSVQSRKELDLGGEPAKKWRQLEQDYRFWLGGGDVTAP